MRRLTFPQAGVRMGLDQTVSDFKGLWCSLYHGAEDDGRMWKCQDSDWDNHLWSSVLGGSGARVPGINDWVSSETNNRHAVCSKTQSSFRPRIVYYLSFICAESPVLSCHLRVSGSSARSLSDVFRLAFNIGFVFSHSPSFCPPAIETSTGSYVPAGGGKTERRQAFFFTFSRQWLSTGTQESTAYFLQCKPDVKQWSMAALLSSKADKCRPKM